MRRLALLLLLLAGCSATRIVAPENPPWQVPLKQHIIDFEYRDDGETHLSVRLGDRVVYDSGPLADVNFVYPTFYRAATRTLMLADFGNEDAWGVIALSFEGDTVRDLGQISVTAPPEAAAFAVPRASVRDDDGVWTIKFRGPLLTNSAEETDHLIARKGEHVVFRERDGKFVMDATAR